MGMMHKEGWVWVIKRTLAALVLVMVVMTAGCIPSRALGSEEAADQLIFAYGTLLDADVQRRVIGRTVESMEDVLHGYRRGELSLTRATYFIAIPDDCHHIEGGVIAVTPAELIRIDRYEGPHYERAEVVLASGKEAWVYRQPT